MIPSCLYITDQNILVTAVPYIANVLLRYCPVQYGCGLYKTAALCDCTILYSCTVLYGCSELYCRTVRHCTYSILLHNDYPILTLGLFLLFLFKNRIEFKINCQHPQTSTIFESCDQYDV